MTALTVVERELTRICEERGVLIPADVVEIASDPAHPLHTCFEWDDTEAAAKYRLAQAAGLIRSVKIRVVKESAGESEEFTVRRYMSVRQAGVEDPDDAGGYVPQDVVRSNPVARQVTLQRMQREINSLRRRYAHLAEFWQQMDEISAGRKAS